MRVSAAGLKGAGDEVNAGAGDDRSVAAAVAAADAAAAPDRGVDVADTPEAAAKDGRNGVVGCEGDMPEPSRLSNACDSNPRRARCCSSMRERGDSKRAVVLPVPETDA